MATQQTEVLSQLKIPMTPMGIKTCDLPELCPQW